MIELKNVSRMYAHGTKEIQALHGITLNIKARFLSVMGPSRSGKSTLLNVIGGLDQPTSGEIFIDNRPLHGIPDDELTLIRRRRVGFIFSSSISSLF
jgi:putative ABC transport system ATP-binding protein